MELSSLLSDDLFTDRPRYVCPVISAFLRGYNDAVSDELRRDLIPVAAAVVGSHGGDSARRRARTEALTDWAVEVWARGRWRTPWAPLFPPQNGFLQLEEVGHYVGRRANRDPAVHDLTLRLVGELVATASEPATTGAADRVEVVAGPAAR